MGGKQTLGNRGILIALDLLVAWLMSKQNERRLKKDIDAMEPRIREELLKHVGAVANINELTRM